MGVGRRRIEYVSDRWEIATGNAAVPKVITFTLGQITKKKAVGRIEMRSYNSILGLRYSDILQDKLCRCSQSVFQKFIHNLTLQCTRMEKPRRGKWTWRGVTEVPLTRMTASSLFSPISVPTVGWCIPVRYEGEVRTCTSQSAKGSLTGISRCDANGLTKRESESARLCGIKYDMILHTPSLDQLQGLIACQLLHGNNIRSLSGLEVLPQAGHPLSSQSGS